VAPDSGCRRYHAVHDVNTDVLLTGVFPGDGQPKPVVFPAPGDVAELDEGRRMWTG
jgi:hypothetical protein